MYFETLKVLNGTVLNASYHVTRARRTQEAVYGQATFSERAWAGLELPPGLYRLRIDYDEQVRKAELHPYTLLEHTFLPLHEVGDFTYAHKSADRDFFTTALQQYPHASDVLFHRDGYLLDTCICNLAFAKDGKWYTPDTYLLPGTKRAFLLEQGTLMERRIHVEDLPAFHYVAFINAMRDFEKIYRYTLNGDRLEVQGCSRM